MFAYPFTSGKHVIDLLMYCWRQLGDPPKCSKLYPGSFADAGHVYVHMRNGIIGEQVGGHGVT